ncbi:MAG: cysteine hydrolase family protein [Dehalococcoidia bacterium]
MTARGLDLSPERSALLVVDVQNDFCGGGGGEVIRDGLARLVETARAAGAFRVFIRAIYDPKYLGAPFAAQLEDLGRLGLVCQEGSDGAKYWPGFEARPGPREIEVEKHRYSAFRQTGLTQRLRAEGITTVVVTGLTLSTCVGSTARDAFFEDFFVVVASDAVHDPDPEREASELAFLSRLFGAVMTSDEISAAWTRRFAGVAE